MNNMAYCTIHPVGQGEWNDGIEWAMEVRKGCSSVCLRSPCRNRFIAARRSWAHQEAPEL
jgi:hypothetical protein